jgi:hypothetical protein
MDQRSSTDFTPAQEAIRQHGEQLARLPGVLAVRPGFAARGGEMADPAVVVLVLRKLPYAELPAAQQIPARLGGVPVDVQQASVEEQLALWQMRGNADLSPPDQLQVWAAGSGIVDLRTPIEREERPESAVEAERIDYPKPDFELREVNERMTVTLHASPDNGWRELRKFLAGPIGHLSATIYEFEAEHVLDAIVQGLGAAGTMDFVMQHSAEAGAWDNDDAHAALSAALGNRLSFAWAPVVSSRATTQGWFPTAYHQKVIVKDHRSFWLSSGNWKGSGQPVEDPFNPPPGFDERRFQSDKNREWHVVADCAALASQFEAFIEHDLKTAAEVQHPEAGPETESPDVFIPLDTAAPEAEVQWFEPLMLSNEKLRVRPLLSPDDFIEQITELVGRAQHRLYIQNQYVKPTNIARWKKLNELIRDFSQRPGVDFKIIIRDTRYWESLEMMRQFGVDTTSVKKLKGSHTKGIIVDDHAVVVGSHNWSGQGFMENRDASLIFHDPRVIAYFERLFLYDYERASFPRRTAPAVESRFAAEGEATPAGMQRVRWTDYRD